MGADLILNSLGDLRIRPARARKAHRCKACGPVRFTQITKSCSYLCPSGKHGSKGGPCTREIGKTPSIAAPKRRNGPRCNLMARASPAPQFRTRRQKHRRRPGHGHRVKQCVALPHSVQHRACDHKPASTTRPPFQAARRELSVFARPPAGAEESAGIQRAQRRISQRSRS